MNIKRMNAWMVILILLLLIDIVMHFIAYQSVGFGAHLNYLASILMAFTIGVWGSDLSLMYQKKKMDEEKEIDEEIKQEN